MRKRVITAQVAETLDDLRELPHGTWIMAHDGTPRLKVGEDRWRYYNDYPPSGLSYSRTTSLLLPAMVISPLE